MRRFLILIACVVAGAASTQAWGDDPPPPPEMTSAPEPVTVSSPQPAPEPAPKPDPAPPTGALQPPKTEKASGTPPPAAVQPPEPVRPASPPPAQPAPTAVPKLKHKATHEKKPHAKAGKKYPRPKQQPAPLEPSGGVAKHATGRDDAPPVSGLEPPAASDGPIVTGLGEPLRHGGGGTRAVLSTMLFALLGLAIVLFGLAAVPVGVLGDALVSVLVATRRVELAAGGALALAASVTILAFISLSS